MLAVELGEADAVGLVADQEVEDGPYQGEAAVLAGEAAHHLRSPLDLAERSLEQVGAAPAPAVAWRVAQVHDERVEVVGEALRRGGEAALVELLDEGLESLFGVLFVDRVVECLPVGALDAFAFSFGELGVEVSAVAPCAAPASTPTPRSSSPRNQTEGLSS